MPGDITLLLQSARAGDADSLSQAYGLLYEEMRRIAAGLLRGGDGTLTPTVLVHEAYLRLCGGDGALGVENRKHFFATAAQAMRWLLVDRARRLAAERHGGALVRVELDDGLAQELRPEELLALDTALQRLGEIDPARRELVELRFFAGLDYAELVPLLGRSERTLKREGAAARAALQAMMA